MRINVPIIFALILSSLISFWLASIGWQRKTKGSQAFTTLMAACGLWSLLFLVELSFTYTPVAIWAAKLTYISLVTIPVAWTVFAFDYEQSSTWINSRRRLIPALSLIPIITVLLAITNEYHHLIWTSLLPIDNGQMILLAPKFGKWFWMHACYSYLLLAIGTFILARQALVSRYRYRWQLVILLSGIFLPWISNIIFLTKLSPIRDFDFTSLTFTLSGLLLGWNLFRYHFLGIVPIARQLVLDSIAESVAVLDLQHRVIDINSAGLKFLGCSFEDVLGRQLIDVSPASAAEMISKYNKMLYAQDELQLHPADQPADSQARDYELFMSPIQDRRGQILGRLVILRDITTRKNAEHQMQSLNAELELRVVERTAELAEINQLLAEERELLALRVAERTSALQAANAKLATAARLKDQFLATISHELRTPLNAILGITESLQTNVYGSLQPAQLKALQTLQESGELLLTHINEILDVSRLEANKLQLQIAAVSVQQICNTSIVLIRPQAKKKNIEILYRPDPQVNVLQLDPLRFQQILVNLLSNAVKFTPIGGKIGLRIEGDPAAKVVNFTVADTGIGISPDDLTQLFKPFSQLDGNLNRTYGGTGLGLVLVQRLTKLHNGSVSVKSQPGKGSSFTVSIPWNGRTSELSSNKPSQAAVVPEVAPYSVTILLCEDNLANAEILCRYLLAQGYKVHHATDGRQGLAMAFELKPQIILMDIQMPGMDGLEAIRQLRQAEATRTTPIIAITGLAMPQDYQRCINAGADNYMSKPIKLASLQQLIQSSVKRQHQQTAQSDKKLP